MAVSGSEETGANSMFNCWNCGGSMRKHVACELICDNCGFIRDCSDP
ncbi:hypothetical protein SVXNc_0472 [Candidatus Nanohalococcus occultus]|uniref:Uncharacterized protein n=1 Tax=Candidatus Nanohalococcus occultus TaxID=2978047 RepID=A0ABY8CE70_9ARCH|nr:hypothetical protein SVXNc_0472 [Candidatus Nanohaloarchaeota archaeon SVXNc]